MIFFSNMSLRSLLVSGFLFCALLTGISGGAGVFSLGQVKAVMGLTARNVTANVDTQNLRIQQLVPVRKILSRMIQTRTAPELETVMNAFSELEKKQPSQAGETGQIYRAVRELAEKKQAQISALTRLETLIQDNIRILEAINALTFGGVSAAIDQSVQSIETQAGTLKNTFGRLLMDRKAPVTAAKLEKTLYNAGITDGLDELMMVSEMSISGVRAAMSVQSIANRQLAVVNDIKNAADPAALEKASARILKLQNQINSELIELPEHESTGQIIDRLKAFTASFESMIQAKKVELSTLREMMEKQTQIMARISAVENKVLSDGQALSQGVSMRLGSAADGISRWQTIQVIIVAGAIAAALFIGFFVARVITAPIKKAIGMLKDIARGDGDLTLMLDESSGNEIGQLGHWFNRFTEKLRGIIADIDQHSKSLDSAATDTHSLSTDLSRGAEAMAQQSGTVADASKKMDTNLAEVAAAAGQSSDNLGQVTASVETVTGTMDQIARSMEETRNQSRKAVERTGTVSRNMDRLGRSAADIDQVVETISDISEQTNLLALNATIEAARAGEAGKGFAVVADEIKALARQTATATTEIKDQITRIQDSTQSTLAELTDVDTAINGVNEMIDQAAGAVEAQSDTSRQIAENIGQADGGIQDVTAKVADSASVAGQISSDIAGVSRTVNQMAEKAGKVTDFSGQLKQVSDRLKQTVNQFKIKA